MSIQVKVEALEKARIQRGYSQRRLAKVAKLSSALISQIENKERNPSPQSAKKICDALDVDFEAIFFTVSVSKSKHETA
jgi:transcriptional regulator with XRE-family HTH domain